MAAKLCRDRVRALVSLTLAASSLAFSSVALTQVAMLLAGGVYGWIFLHALALSVLDCGGSGSSRTDGATVVIGSPIVLK